MITLTLTKEEAQALLALIDAGVKALGRPAAKACAILDDKVQTAFLSEQTKCAAPSAAGAAGQAASRANGPHV